MQRVWRLHHNPQLLASRVLNLGTTSGGFSTAAHRGYHSWGSKGLRGAALNLSQSCLWKIGDGRSVKVLKDRWIRDHVPMFKDHINLRLAATLTVKDFIVEDNGGWNILKAHRFFTPESARRILAIELLSHSPPPDCLY